MNILSKITKVSGLTAAVFALTLSSCSDAWDSHYSYSGEGDSNESLWSQMEKRTDLSDFRQVLQATKVSSYSAVSEVSFAELLNSDQSFTVWAPVNGSFNKDSLLSLCQNYDGQRLVEKRFVRNHIARFLYPISSITDKQVLLMNKKVRELTSLKLGEGSITSTNKTSRNGILHIVGNTVNYWPGIYEELGVNSELASLGGYLKKYQKDSLDEFSSVASGIVDGKTVYIDSVMIPNNALLNELGRLDKEDSLYWVVAPTNAAWTAAYSKTKPYFNYLKSVSGSDSISDYWAKHAIIADMVFNPRMQISVQDSLTSTNYNSKNPYPHVFYKPYQSGGILSDVKDTITCSNGKIFRVNTWPYSLSKVFFVPLKTEAEGETSVIANTLCTTTSRYVLNKGLSQNSYLDVVPTNTSSNPTITFQVKNTLSGKYDVCVVFAPKTVYQTPYTHEDSVEILKGCKFKANINYLDATGASKSFACANGLTMTSNGNKLDTVCIAEKFQFPVCNFNQDEATVSIKIQCYVLSRETATYSREMFIDCIYLKPRED